MNGAITERKGITYCMQRELVGHQEMSQMKGSCSHTHTRVNTAGVMSHF